MPDRYSIVATNHCGPKAEEMIRQLAPGAVAILMREPKNAFDKNAIAVWIDGVKVGYLPKKGNVYLAAKIDQYGFGTPAPMAMDAAEATVNDGPWLAAKFVRSLNSGFPQVEIE